jgi:hypothetical protein
MMPATTKRPGEPPEKSRSRFLLFCTPMAAAATLQIRDTRPRLASGFSLDFMNALSLGTAAQHLIRVQ